jgi:AraC-like DNA-binding protein
MAKQRRHPLLRAGLDGIDVLQILAPLANQVVHVSLPLCECSVDWNRDRETSAETTLISPSVGIAFLAGSLGACAPDPDTSRGENEDTMTRTTDLEAGAPQSAALIEQALSLLRLSSAMLVRAEFAAPWALESMAPDECASLFATGGGRVLLFHVLVEGRCLIRLERGEPVAVEAGEAIVLPYGDRHVISDSLETPAVPVLDLLPPLPWASAPTLRLGGKGMQTRILCGYLECEDLLFHPLSQALPPLIHFRPPSTQAAELLRAAARYGLAAPGKRTGSHARLAETLLVDCLRQHLMTLPPQRMGWLAALRDPVVGRAMLLLHQAPADQWTAGALARRVAVSTTVLRDRFAEVLGEPPMRYLQQWRIHLASHLLRTTDATVQEVASRVGYESQPAFSRAFARTLGRPPSSLRVTRQVEPSPMGVEGERRVEREHG